MKKRKNKSSLAQRFSLVSFVAIFICVTLFSLVQFIFMDDIYALAAKISMLDAAGEISLIDFDSKDYLPMISDYETSKGIYIEIYSDQGNLIYTTEGNDYIYNPTEKDNQILQPRNMKLLSHSDRDDGSYFEMREEAFATAQYIVYGTFFDGNKSMQIYYPVDTITKNAETASWVLFALCIVALVLYYSSIVFFALAFTRPVSRINSTAKKIAKLDFTEHCPSFRLHELNELSESVNTLSHSLEDALNSLKVENRQLEYDIRKERELEKSRREFVANASHELKTPIAIIQGYAEGMKYGIGCDSTDEFCDIIIEESEKMNSLVIKLLEFLHLGSGEYPLSIQEFYLDCLLVEHLDSLKNLLQDKDISLECSIGSSLPASGDPTLLKIVFNNYLSNAVSHAGGEKIIRVTVKEMKDCYRVFVFNTGSAIADTDLQNIWQSFYRADKSHSRKEGRFGLGLSIVSSTQRLHGCDFGVENKENGVEFFFDVKKAAANENSDI